MARGTLTAQMARILSRADECRGFDVLFDHGQKGTDPPDKLGKIVSWFGSEYKLSARLALLDIAVVLHGSRKVFALIEIEETTDKPKVLLGDVLATLLGDRITFQRKRNLEIGPWTTLIVFACSSEGTHQTRIDLLEKQVNQLRSRLSTPNASIGRIVIDTFRDRLELQDRLKRQVAKALLEVE